MGASTPSQEGEDNPPICHTQSHTPISMSTLIKELSVFVTKRMRKAIMLIFDGFDLQEIASCIPQSLQNKRILEHGIMPEVVISRIFVSIVIVEFITKSINWESGTQPAEENVIGNILFRRMRLDIGFVWQLVVGVSRATRDMRVVSSTWCSKCSESLFVESLQNKKVIK